jgi:villin 1/advillin
MKAVPVPPELNGIFYGGDSYILKYTYMKSGKECYIFYFWQGNKSSNDEKGASALLTVKMDDEIGGAGTQVRVVQGKEPNHFVSLFKGKLIIRSGGKASGFKNKNDHDTYNTSGTSLFSVRGSNQFNTRAVEVESKAASLNSDDAFVLSTPNSVMVWYGKIANKNERNNAMNVANALKAKKSVKEVEEGAEPADFWSAIGGKGPYVSSRSIVGDAHEPRLFQCSNATGAFRVDEIFNFNQDDLDEDDVFILDTFDEVYVWVGSGSNETEKKAALTTAIAYVETAADGRSKDTPIIRVNSGSEPPLFTAYFQGWDSSRGDAYERKLKEIGITPPVDARANLAAYSQKYSFEELKKRPLPPTVDAGVLENYLADADFPKVFKMDKTAFLALPAWKRNAPKNKAGLF